VPEEFRRHRPSVQFAHEPPQDGFVAAAAWPGEHRGGPLFDLAGEPLVTFPGDASVFALVIDDLLFGAAVHPFLVVAHQTDDRKDFDENIEAA
jgi:hypothetical protein